LSDTTNSPRLRLFLQRLPGSFIVVGLVLLIAGMLASYAGSTALIRDNELRKSGATVVGTVDSIEQHVARSGIEKLRMKGSKRFDSYEFTPYVSATVAGKSVSFIPRSYTTLHRDDYEIGQKVTIMYDPADPQHDPGVKEDFARSEIVGTTHTGVGFDIAGGAAVLAGLVLFARRGLIRRRKNFELENRTA